jgi:2-phospho-L-lactate guanylyltransferase
MNWRAVIPFKGSADRKTRLEGRLGPRERLSLSQDIFDHVTRVLRACPALTDIGLLSDVRPEDWQGTFIQDEGRGLNAELSALAEATHRTHLLVIHADLPLVTATDVNDLLDPGADCTIAPDRFKTGTNALALSEPVGFAFAFGVGSFARHLDASRGRARVVSRLGLGLDIDTAEDLEEAIRQGLMLRNGG